MRRKQKGAPPLHPPRPGIADSTFCTYNTPVGRRQGALKANAKAKSERSRGAGSVERRRALREIEAFDAQLGVQIPAVKPRKTTQHFEEDS